MAAEVRVRSLAALLGAAFAVCGCAGGGTTSERGSAGNTFVAADGQTIRCVNEAVTGSRVPQRVCRTEAEWQRLEEASKDYTRGVQGPLTAPPES
jgi:hypothetical protein